MEDFRIHRALTIRGGLTSNVAGRGVKKVQSPSTNFWANLSAGALQRWELAFVEANSFQDPQNAIIKEMKYYASIIWPSLIGNVNGISQNLWVFAVRYAHNECRFRLSLAGANELSGDACEVVWVPYPEITSPFLDMIRINHVWRVVAGELISQVSNCVEIEVSDNQQGLIDISHQTTL